MTLMVIQYIVILAVKILFSLAMMIVMAAAITNFIDEMRVIEEMRDAEYSIGCKLVVVIQILLGYLCALVIIVCAGIVPWMMF